ncbi:MAG: MBOAT family protein [Lachnospiraceae bacterium]|nr:MBOAT family protein [Lachnospiraceae bacterium]
MQFNSITFIIIFPILLILYYLIPKRFRYLWLLICSYSFYYLGSGSFTALLAVSTIITYITGIALDAFDGAKVRKAIVFVSVILQILPLFVFKYLDFTLDLFQSGLRFNLMIPLGISFYTFQAISYIVDVYRRNCACEKNVLKLALYLSFFLSIVSGPINRAGDMLGQYTNSKLSYDNIKRGMQKMLWGYFLKLAIAGRLAIVVDNVYGDIEGHSGFTIAIAALSYMFMLYCDFEGYSQIAIGSGYMLGITMKENFRQPFCSTSLSEMWRRWHVSLSTWFRDYLYIPLGGSRRGVVRKYVNLFIVLFVSGIWHGANLTFFIWGALNGAYIIIGQILLPYRDRLADIIKKKICPGDAGAVFDKVRTAFLRIGVYILFSYVFIFFANDSVTSAWFAIKGILMRFDAGNALGQLTSLGLGSLNLAFTLIMIIFVMIADRAANSRSCDTPALITNIPTPVRWAIYYALITAILFSANLSGQEFIYSKM